MANFDFETLNSLLARWKRGETNFTEDEREGLRQAQRIDAEAKRMLERIAERRRADPFSMPTLSPLSPSSDGIEGQDAPRAPHHADAASPTGRDGAEAPLDSTGAPPHARQGRALDPGTDSETTHVRPRSEGRRQRRERAAERRAASMPSERHGTSVEERRSEPSTPQSVVLTRAAKWPIWGSWIAVPTLLLLLIVWKSLDGYVGGYAGELGKQHAQPTAADGASTAAASTPANGGADASVAALPFSELVVEVEPRSDGVTKVWGRVFVHPTSDVGSMSDEQADHTLHLAEAGMEKSVRSASIPSELLAGASSTILVRVGKQGGAIVDVRVFGVRGAERKPLVSAELESNPVNALNLLVKWRE